MNKIAVPTVEALKAKKFYAETLAKQEEQPKDILDEFNLITSDLYKFTWIGRYDPKSCVRSPDRFGPTIKWADDEDGIVKFIINEELKKLPKEYPVYEVIPKQTIAQRRQEIRQAVIEAINVNR